MDRGQALMSVPSSGGTEKPIIDQISHDRRDGLNGIQFGRTETGRRWLGGNDLVILHREILELDAGNHPAHFVEEIKRHGDHRVSQFAKFLVESFVLLVVLVDVVLDKWMLARDNQADNAASNRKAEANDVFASGAAVVSRDQVLLLLIEQPDAAFVRLDPLE